MRKRRRKRGGGSKGGRVEEGRKRGRDLKINFLNARESGD